MAVKSRFVIGHGAVLDAVCDAWTAALPVHPVVRIELGQGPDYRFEWSPLDAVARDSEAFMAFDERFGNFTRLELFQAGVERGLHMTSFISPRALVAPGVLVGPNCFIGDGAIVGARAVVEYNCVIGAGAIVGAGARLKSSCWLAAGVQVGDDVELGAHVTLRQGVAVAAGVRIGRNSELGVPGHYRENVAPRTVFDPRYDAPIFTYGN